MSLMGDRKFCTKKGYGTCWLATILNKYLVKIKKIKQI